MKKLLITLIPALIIMCLILALTPSRSKADELAHWLYGYVHYSNGSGVGQGKPVRVYDSPDHYLGYVLTDSNSWYKWSFYHPFYVYKVRCAFYIEKQYYCGETIIDDTLWVDTRFDITVDECGAPPDGAGF